MTQKKRNGQKKLFPELGMTSRLTVPGTHSLLSTPKSRPKRRVETSEDPWDVSQPSGSFHPAYRSPPTAKRRNLHIAPPEWTIIDYQYKDVRFENWAPRPPKAGRTHGAVWNELFIRFIERVSEELKSFRICASFPLDVRWNIGFENITLSSRYIKSEVHLKLLIFQS